MIPLWILIWALLGLITLLVMLREKDLDLVQSEMDSGDWWWVLFFGVAFPVYWFIRLLELVEKAPFPSFKTFRTSIHTLLTKER